MTSGTESSTDRGAGAVVRDAAVRRRAVSRRWWVLALCCAACTLPLLVAAIALGARGWTPVGEFAQAELRVRDFWAHPPSLGAVGRLRTETDVSSHPGPSAWWAMYPVYALLGRSAAGLSAAVAATAAAWLVGSLAVGWRRAGDTLTVLLALGALGLIAGLGPSAFVEPWNPWFTVMPFLCMVMAVWAVIDGSRWAIVLVAAAGTYCVHAHFGYTPLVATLGATALVGLWWSGPRARGAEAGRWRAVLWPVAVAAGLTAVMWLPPLYEQLTGDPGNIGIMVSAYSQQTDAEPELGVAGAIKLVAAWSDPRTPWLLLDDPRPTDRGVGLGTLLFLGVWAGAAWVAWQGRATRRLRAAAQLQLVCAAGWLAALVASSRIPGEVFGYLVIWLAVLVTATMVAIAWTAWLNLSGDRPAGWPHGARLAAVTVLGVGSLATAAAFSDPDVPAAQLSDVADHLVGAAFEALPGGDTFVLRWEDPLAFGGIGTAVLSELERRGVHVGVDRRLSAEMRPHRVIADGTADAAIWVVTGDAIRLWKALPDAEEIAYRDPRSDADIQRQEALATEIEAALEQADAAELVAELPLNQWAVRSDPRVGPAIDELIDEYTAIGLPTAVFLAPTGQARPAP